MIIWKGNLRGSGGVRIEGAFEGDIPLRGLVVVGETGRVTCENLRANSVIVAGTVNGCITAEKLDIRSTGRVWGDVTIVNWPQNDYSFGALCGVSANEAARHVRRARALSRSERVTRRETRRGSFARVSMRSAWRNPQSSHRRVVCRASPK